MDWLLDALLDSLKLIPFLFLAYVLIEFLETVVSKKINNSFFKGKCAPLIGASFGMVPQCGFSVVATDLYSQKKITVGTLIAIFIATSDEAIPILLGNLNSSKNVYILLSLILAKFVIGVVFGYAIDMSLNIFYKNKLIKAADSKNSTSADNHQGKEHLHDHNSNLDATCNISKTAQSIIQDNHNLQTVTIHKGCCGHDIEEDHVHPAKQYVLHPLIHTLKVFAYILLVNIVFSACVFYLGEERILNFLLTSSYFAPLLACIIGLIPNCASSVILTNLLVIGGLSFSACLAGLIVNAGIAYLVLFKQNKNLKANLAIISTMFVIATVSGYILMAFGV